MWEYISKSEATLKKEVLERWHEHEEKEGRETLAAQADRELRQKWHQHEARECYIYGPNPGTRYRADTMSQPELRPCMGWR